MAANIHVRPPKVPASPRILLIQPKRIGDLILTAPALGILRRDLPGAHLTLASAGASAALAPLLKPDASLAYLLHRPNLPLWFQLPTGHFDLAIDFGGTARSALMTRLSRAPIRASYLKFVGAKRRARAYSLLCDANPRNLHTVDFHLALVKDALRALAASRQFAIPHSPAPAPPSIHISPPLSDAARLRVARHTGSPDPRYAIVHPGTARPEKYWLPDRWAAAIHHIASLGLVPVLTGSNDPSERGHLAKIHHFLHEFPHPNPALPAVLDLTGQLSLPELAALIASCHLAVTVDSAAMHLAAAFCRPQVALFGPTNPFHWRPRHPAAAVLVASSPDTPTTVFTPHHPKAPMSDISTDAVIGAINCLPVA